MSEFKDWEVSDWAAALGVGVAALFSAGAIGISIYAILSRSGC